MGQYSTSLQVPEEQQMLGSLWRGNPPALAVVGVGPGRGLQPASVHGRCLGVIALLRSVFTPYAWGVGERVQRIQSQPVQEASEPTGAQPGPPQTGADHGHGS
ncbi:MAG: hypothetical protein RLZZ117_1633 [Cyanobacteriota bacterium]|jgi:hypothetical protein